MRQPARRKGNRSPVYDSRTVTAPLRGWNTRDPLSSMAAGYAYELTNFYPTPTQLVLRPGMVSFATGLGVVKTILSYDPQNIGDSRIFAVTNLGIYNITAGGAVGAVEQALTNGYVQSVNYGTTAGSYLFVVNGVDDSYVYNGSTWTSLGIVSINGGGTVNSNLFSNVAVAHRRVWFTRENSSVVYYLPLNAFTGNVTQFPLGGAFPRGGACIAIGNWSIDGGNGQDDYTVFVSSKGQIVVYRGSDPDSSTGGWEKVGTFDMALPCGARCLEKFGGDLLYLSLEGVLPLSQSLQSAKLDYSTALTDAVNPSFTALADLYRTNEGWQAAVHPNTNALIINIPLQEYDESVQYVMNTKSRAWTLFTGWNIFCLQYVNGRVYAGMSDKVVRIFEGTADLGEAISAISCSAYEYLGTRAQNKHPKLLRPNVASDGNIDIKLGVDADFQRGIDYTLMELTSTSGALWDVAYWDQDIWGSDAPVNTNWHTAPANPGYCHSIRLETTSATARFTWSIVDMSFERGALL